jgi:O-antigen ligase
MDNFFKLKHKNESIIIILLPFLMIFSRFMLEACLLIISISFIVKTIKSNSYKIFNNHFNLFFISFYFLIVLSFAFSEEKLNILSALLYFRFGLYVMAIYYFINEENKIIKYFLNSILIIILILFFDSVIQYLFGQNLVGLKNDEIHRITSFFGDEQIMGSYVVKLFPFLLLLKNKIDKNLKKTNYLILLAIFVTPFIIFLSGERVAMALFFLMMCYYLVFFVRSKKFKFIYFYVLFSILSIGVLLYSSNVYYDRYISQTYQSLFNKTYSQNKFFLPNKYQKGDFYFLSAQHQNFIYTGINIFKKNKLLGSGPKSYRYVCDNKDYEINDLSCNTHPHNYYLQVLIEIGLLGFIFLFLTYLYIIYRSFINFIRLLKNQYFSLSEVIILGFYFTQLWPLMQHGSFFNNWNSISLFLPMAFLLFFREKKINKLSKT